jgi:hypothetical protein
MKDYVKLVQAEQYLGDKESLKEFVGAENFFEKEDVIFIPEVIGEPSMKWKVLPNDYIVKTHKGFDVYKQERFEKEFDEVTIQESLEAPIAITKPIETKATTKKKVETEK